MGARGSPTPVTSSVTLRAGWAAKAPAVPRLRATLKGLGGSTWGTQEGTAPRPGLLPLPVPELPASG